MRRKNSNRGRVGGKSEAQQSTIWRQQALFSSWFVFLSSIFPLRSTVWTDYFSLTDFFFVNLNICQSNSPGLSGSLPDTDWIKLGVWNPTSSPHEVVWHQFLLGARDWQDMFAQKGSFLYIGVVFQSLPSISREIRQFVPSDCLQGNKDDGNHSSPPPPPQMHGTRVAHKRWLFTRGPTVNRGGSIGTRWSHMCLKFLILITTIVVKFSPDSARHWTNQTSGF